MKTKVVRYIRKLKSISAFIAIIIIIVINLNGNGQKNEIFIQVYPRTNHSTLEYAHHIDDKKLLVLFTSLIYDKNREIVYNNTMKNWAKLGHGIQPVLFVDNKKIANDFLAYGWDVYGLDKVVVEGKKPPVLKQMFVAIQQKYPAHFIGIANADVLFTEELPQTMGFLKDGFDFLFSKLNVMIVGRRTNVTNVSNLNPTSFQNISSLAKSDGKLQTPDAMDLFITNHDYPWINLPDLVIGRVKYDNWMVARARKNGHVTVDVTNTVLMLHQVVDKGSRKDFENKRKFRVNLDLLNSTYTNINFRAGLATCTSYFTSNEVGTITLNERKELRQDCFDYYKYIDL